MRLFPHKRINHFRNWYEICRKDLLAKNIKRYKRQLEKDGNVQEAAGYDFTPLTYNLPSEYSIFFEEYKRASKAMWIMKPVIMKLFRSEEVRVRVSFCSTKSPISQNGLITQISLSLTSYKDIFTTHCWWVIKNSTWDCMLWSHLTTPWLYTYIVQDSVALRTCDTNLKTQTHCNHI